MEYLAHGDLKKRLREGLQPLQVLHIMQQIADALSLLHQNNIVHRDIKPANILFREPEHAVLADFGIARNIEQNTQLTNTGFVLGTPSYMSPEQINGGHVTAKTDIYALGVVFYEMLTGHLPYRGDSVQSVATQHLMAPVPPLPLEVRRLQPLLNSLMAKKPEDRIANGSELLEALARIDSSRGFAVKPPTFAQIHAKKIVAVTGLMFGSVAITWAGISQLPYWLNDAASQGEGAQIEALMEPALKQAPVPEPISEPAPGTTDTATANNDVKLQPVAAPQPVAPVAVETISRAVEPEKKLAANPSPSQQKSTRQPAKPKPEKKSIPAPEQSVVAEVAPPQSISSSAEDPMPAKQEIAEPRAAYASAETVTMPQQKTESPSGPVELAPAAPQVPEATEQKKKLPPVISFF
jgi:serine/threonine protein kinase